MPRERDADQNEPNKGENREDIIGRFPTEHLGCQAAVSEMPAEMSMDPKLLGTSPQKSRKSWKKVKRDETVIN
jgi:hypothetical protein